jgi:hypothetical protein
MSRHMERTTVRLPSELLARARKKAAAEGRTLTSLIEEGLREAVATRPKSKPKRRVELPVSSATGGLLPGVDAANLARYAQELDDIEYVDRMKSFK